MANPHIFAKMKLGSMQGREAARTLKKALQEDPTVFQYDEVFDEMESARTEKKEKERADRKPKYIHELLKTAEKRQRENERRIEKQAQKDLEKEGDMYKDKDAFVTSSYKKKMEELQRLEEEEKRQDAIDDLTDVTKQGDLSGFYRHLYRSTMDKPEAEKGKTSAADSKKESRQTHHDNHETKPRSSARSRSRSKSRSPSRKEHLPERKSANSPERRREKDRHRIEEDTKEKRRDRDRDRTDRYHPYSRRDHGRSRSRSPSRKDRKSRYDPPDFSDRHRRDRDRHRVENEDRDTRRDRGGAGDRYFSHPRRDHKEKGRRSRSRSPPRREQHHSNKSSTTTHPQPSQSPADGNQSKPSSKTATIATPVVKLKDNPIWKKRTVGEVYKNALERYIERKRNGVISV